MKLLLLRIGVEYSDEPVCCVSVHMHMCPMFPKFFEHIAVAWSSSVYVMIHYLLLFF